MLDTEEEAIVQLDAPTFWSIPPGKVAERRRETLASFRRRVGMGADASDVQRAYWDLPSNASAADYATAARNVTDAATFRRRAQFLFEQRRKEPPFSAPTSIAKLQDWRGDDEEDDLPFSDDPLLPTLES